MSITCPRCGHENEEGTQFCTSCEFPLSEIPLLVHNRYRLSKPYSFSSFRAVYEAEDVKDNNKIYSVREFLPNLVSSGERLTAMSQFEALMNRYKQLHHRNLASIVDFFVEGNYFYVVYEFVNGLDITKYMHSYKISKGMGYPEHLVSHWTLQMCDLFEYLHYHQDPPIFLVDFKPHAVVFRKEDEQLVFIDLGLSKILSILGPHYLISEDFLAFRKSGGKLESFSWDLFCLGNCMYFLLTGIDLLKMPSSKYPPLRNVRPDISLGMVEVVERALGENYKSGYTDVRDLKRDLAELVPPRPLRAYDFYSDFVGDRPEYKKTEWLTMLGNNARTNSIGLPPSIPLKLKWKCKLKPTQYAYLFSGGDYVYALTHEGLLYGVHKDTGRLEWNTFVCRKMSASGITAEGNLYFISPNRELLAIEHGSNNFKWKLEMESPAMAPPTLYEEILFVALYNGTIYAVSTDEGKILNRYKVEGNILTSPIVYKHILYVASLNKKICAIDVDTEEMLWQYESETGFSASPSITRDIIFAGTHDGTLHGVSMDSGSLLWSRNFKGAITQSVRAALDMIYFVTRKGKLVALTPEKGDTVWDKDLGNIKQEVPFCLGTNMIFVVDNNKTLRIIDSFTGIDRQRLGMSHYPASQLIVSHRQLYLYSKSGHLVAFGR